MQYKRLTISSSLLHNFQPIRKRQTNQITKNQGGGELKGTKATSLLSVSFLIFPLFQNKLKMSHYVKSNFSNQMFDTFTI